MSRRTIEVRIGPNGEIEAETFGMKGQECLSYVTPIAKLAEAEVVDSAFTEQLQEHSSASSPKEKIQGEGENIPEEQA